MAHPFRAVAAGCLGALLLCSGPAAAQSGAGPERIDDASDPEDDDFPDDLGRSPAEGALPGPAAVRPPVQWAGQASLRLAFDLHDDRADGGAVAEDIGELFGQALGHLHYRKSDRLRIRLGGQIDYRLTGAVDPADGYRPLGSDLHRSDFEARLTDSYVELALGRLDLQAGMVTTVWGANDLVNPNDLLAARDLRGGLLVEPEAARLPALTFRGELHLDRDLARFDQLALALVWQPVFVAHRVDLFGSDFALFGPGAPSQLRGLGALLDELVDDSIEGVVQPALLQTRLPRPFAEGDLGLRLAVSVSGWDLALQYGYLHQRLPLIRVREDLAIAAQLALGQQGALTEQGRRLLGQALLGETLPLEASYPRQHQVGLALTRALARVVLTLDLAFVSRRAVPLGGEAPFVDEGAWLATALQSKAVAYTLGARYSWGDDLLLSLQWWHELLLDLIDRPLDQREGLGLGGVRPWLLTGGPQLAGFAALWRFEIDAVDLTCQFLAHVDLLSRSLVITPELHYRVSDRLRLGAGFNIFEGQRGSIGAFYDANDQLYLKVTGFL